MSALARCSLSCKDYVKFSVTLGAAMGQSYAGVLGTLACATIVGRGLLAGHGLESTLLAASVGLFGFATIGWITGQLADYLVGESVRWQFQEAMTAWEKKPTKPATATKIA